MFHVEHLTSDFKGHFTPHGAKAGCTIKTQRKAQNTKH